MFVIKRLFFKIRIVMFFVVIDFFFCCLIGDDFGVDFDICFFIGVDFDIFLGFVIVKLK